MGGHVAGVYAAYYPSDVCSLSLVCPAGELCGQDNLTSDLNLKKHLYSFYC
jgi:pimeloyl-ACP methyl ester carboxylesterase